MRDGLCCCVCLKDEPFDDNPIVSCDGKACTTVVHKVCYGIQHIPDGAWFCQKCISQERTARVRCELCPSREGALKHTNKGGWCHIVCALFVSGAEFLDAERLETVSLDKVASDKLNKVCSICERNNRLDRASVGACIQCIKGGCKAMFHVTCAQSQGLLTEVISTKDGVRYVAYCSLHKQKTKRRDFTIRLSNSSNSLSSHDRNRSRQSPPQLEKSDEDCVTPQESTSSLNYRSCSSKNPNISSSSSNINISSDSMSQDDSSAPEICTSSELRESKESIKIYKERNIPNKFQLIKLSEKLKPPVIFTESLSSDNMLPPNICCSDASESIPKEEATVKLNQFPSSTICKSEGSESSITRSSKRQATMNTPHIPEKREKIFKTEQTIKSSSSATESPLKVEKIKRAKKISMAVKMKIENRVGKKSMPPSLPKSIFHHMNSMISGSPAITSGQPCSTSSIATTSKISGTSCQSMEELLEWQWDQAGTLLMQQAEASDIASLLSCLHDLKNENEQLISKQLKLSHRRDHLKAINAKLQLQLLPKPIESVVKPITNVPSITMNDFRATIPHNMNRPIQKASSVEQTHIQYKQVPHSSQISGEVIRPRLSTEGSSVYIQQPVSVWTQSSSQQGQQNQSLNQQTIALLKHYQQQHQQGMATTSIQSQSHTGVSVSNLFSQTDLVALLNSQLHSQLAGCSQPSVINQPKANTQDIHISPNNGTNMEYLYQTLQQKSQQQKYQPQAPIPSNIYYQTASKLSTQSGTGMNFDSSIPQNPGKNVVLRLQADQSSNDRQIMRPSDCLSQQRSIMRRQIN